MVKDIPLENPPSIGESIVDSGHKLSKVWAVHGTVVILTPLSALLVSLDKLTEIFVRQGWTEVAGHPAEFPGSAAEEALYESAQTINTILSQKTMPTIPCDVEVDDKTMILWALLRLPRLKVAGGHFHLTVGVANGAIAGAGYSVGEAIKCVLERLPNQGVGQTGDAVAPALRELVIGDVVTLKGVDEPFLTVANFTDKGEAECILYDSVFREFRGIIVHKDALTLATASGATQSA